MYFNIAASDNIQLILQHAGEIALKFGSNQIGTEHLLYGIACVKNCQASKFLESAGVTKENIEDFFMESGEVFNLKAVTNLTPLSKEVFQSAQNLAIQLGQNFVGAEHLLYAILINPESFAVKMLISGFNVNIIDLRNRLVQYLQGDMDSLPQDSQSTSENGPKSPLSEKLLTLGSDITYKARQHKIDPIIGRNNEIERVIEILCRKTKNNPVLIGEAGVGKTAVVEGLALSIVSGNVPEFLLNKTIFSLEIGNLMAGTKFRGSMEERLKEIIEEIKKAGNIIVFIDEIHTLAQAGSEKGETSPADMLKPYLARGELQTIGATTTDEYRKFIEKDKALERRFQPIMVNPPSPKETIEILKGLKDSYEAFHKVVISDEAIEAAVNLSDRYIMDRSLPDKAIDLVDEASSRAKVRLNTKPVGVKEKEEKLMSLQASRSEASLQRDYEKAAKLQSEIVAIEKDIETQMEETRAKIHATNVVGSEEIAEVVAKWTGIPVTKITEGEKEKLVHLEEILHQRVIGQDEAIKVVSKTIRRARVGLQDAKKPIGSFIFMGQTGVGKTELCKAIAEAMFDSENNIIRVDMSEYMEAHSVSKLIGAPPGYVGHDDGGQLTEAVRRKPYSVVLFDEIEKAHPDVFNALLQILDEGRLTDSHGRVVSFKNTIIIMTSNIGADAVRGKNSLGFGGQFGSDKADFEQIKSIYMQELRKKFKPEFLNRIDVVCVFAPLSASDLVKIATIMISKFGQRLEAQNLKLKLSQNALQYIVENGADAEYGARPLKRFIQKEIEDRVAEKILLGEFDKEGVIIIDTNEDQTSLTFVME
ncbi:MAG: ATP-dependent Clp protease ATP-binding subunit [Clostridia bacterium]